MSQSVHQFAEYDEATQKHIIELGCFIFDKSLEHIRENHLLVPDASTTVGSPHIPMT